MMKIHFKCPSKLYLVFSHLWRPIASSFFCLSFWVIFSIPLPLILSPSVRKKGWGNEEEFCLLTSVFWLLPSSSLSPLVSTSQHLFPKSLSLFPPLLLSLSHFGIFQFGFSCFAGNSTDFTLLEMRVYSWARTSLGVNHYCSQRFYLSSLQVSLLPTKVPSSW